MRARGAAAVLLAVASAGAAGCGGRKDASSRTAPPAPATAPGTTTSPTAPATPQSEPARPNLPADVDVHFAGTGARGAWVLRRPGHADDPVVVFLHGWTAVDPAVYGGWVTHLVRRGSTVVYPVYQDAPFLAPKVALAGVVAGVRAALAEGGLPREHWVVAGHSAGGAMSADYAASAAGLGLPAAAGVFAAYPGRRIRDIPLTLPEVDPAGIPAATRLIALYGADDQTVGDTTAKRTIARAHTDDERLIRITDPVIDSHDGPTQAGPNARRAFWRRLDALIARVRG